MFTMFVCFDFGLPIIVWCSKLKKRIPVGAKEESWVSAQEILKRFSRDSQESLEVQKGLFLLMCLLFLLVLTMVCSKGGSQLGQKMKVGSQLKRFLRGS